MASPTSNEHRGSIAKRSTVPSACNSLGYRRSQNAGAHTEADIAFGMILSALHTRHTLKRWSNDPVMTWLHCAMSCELISSTPPARPPVPLPPDSLRSAKASDSSFSPDDLPAVDQQRLAVSQAHHTFKLCKIHHDVHTEFDECTTMTT